MTAHQLLSYVRSPGNWSVIDCGIAVLLTRHSRRASLRLPQVLDATTLGARGRLRCRGRRRGYAAAAAKCQPLPSGPTSHPQPATAPQPVELAPLRHAPLACCGFGASRQPRIRSAAFSPISTDGAWVCPRMMLGITDASATRRPSTPRTRSCGSTTLASSLPIRQVPTG